ncbi:hypothetical protein Ahy_A01g001218 [Arachis hypogaea]|uniref:TNase-like domain-containing protein n=1 Tax=Arachis hypogaea TaxID=3818 RepID=A0A445EMF9_ARAHY|nr:hypothetical protein Ahy_A01g001218 [Arachis hypogaea]
MPYGKEAKNEPTKIVQGKSLGIFVYGQDRYGRCVGDLYYNAVFAQWENKQEQSELDYGPQRIQRTIWRRGSDVSSWKVRWSWLSGGVVKRGFEHPVFH